MTTSKKYKLQKGLKFSKTHLVVYGEVIQIGPGTVPTSTASVSRTSMKELIPELKKASKLGLFEKDPQYSD